MDFNYSNITGASFFNRVKLQTFKAIINIAQEKVYEKRFKNWFKVGREYLLEGDKELTKEQIEEINKFWERYKFAYPKINYDEFKAYMNRTGMFDPRYIPNGIRTIFIAPYLQHKQYYWSEQNKTLLSKVFHNIKQPDVIVRKMNHYFYDGEYNRINLARAVELCLNHLNEGHEIILKPNDITGGGVGIEFFKTSTAEELTEIFLNKAQSFVVQNVIEQHEAMVKLNPFAVNTLRITSIIWQGEVVVLAAVVRIGASGKRVDNWNAGGIIVGIDKESGITYSFGLDKKCRKFSETIGGVNLSGGYQIPFWEKVLETVVKAQHNLPYIRLASWDIAIDEEGEPTLIEVNFAGDWHGHQLTTGPILGELTQEILDKTVLEKYHKKHVSLNFDFQEFSDHIALEKYVGNSKRVKVPKMMYGKPVTVIGSRAFSPNATVKEIILPESVKVIEERAFFGCASLDKINIPKGCDVHKSAFISTPVEKMPLF